MNVKKRWVVKLGTGILTRADGRLDGKQFDQLVAQLVKMNQRGHEIILVTSGAIGAGMQEMGLAQRPKELSLLQACATVGQIRLMAEYQKRLSKHKLHGAQLLLTYWDLDSRTCYGQAKQTLELLLERKKFMPIINENDAISGEEIKVGDNDKLSAHVSIMIHAEKLIILSNVDGLMEQWDGNKQKGRVIPVVASLDSDVMSMASGTASQRSVGGMVTKLEAAKLTGVHGIEMIIANGRNPQILSQIADGHFIGTRFISSTNKKKTKK